MSGAKGTKMGFGTLFIGYFLLLNLTYYGFTDLIAAAIMLLGFYKLSRINKNLLAATVSAVVFLVFSFGEFGLTVYEMFFGRISAPALVSFMSIMRSLILGTLTALMLKGIEDVAKEVDLPTLATKASRSLIITTVIYTAWIILETPFTSTNNYALAVLSMITLLATIALLIVNLTIIYSSYMHICMPGDEKLTDKPSRFAFVNEYRARKAERDREANEKRIQLMKERAAKKKGQKK